MHDLVPLLLGRRTIVLAGAGCSTESGIPDYRGPDALVRKRQPMRYQEFASSATGRARYWSRSAVGWPVFSAARPNAAHVALARLEEAGFVKGVITQNVDGLHHAAGSRAVVELHGSLSRVRCLSCDATLGRQELQERLLEQNAEWLERVRARREEVASAPDGDAELAAEDLTTFRVPACDACGGVLKPDVVFFGENVPRSVVDTAWEMLEDAELLLVVGSSLTVYSGRRFVYGARDAGVPVGIINLGPTRADELASVKIEARLGEALTRLADELVRTSP